MPNGPTAVLRLYLAPLAIALLAIALLPPSASAQRRPLAIAAPSSMTGIGAFYGVFVAEGARLAVDEANAEAGEPRIELAVTDDHSSTDDAIALAHQVIASDALAVIGPDLTVVAMSAHDIYAEGRLAAIVPTAHGDDPVCVPIGRVRWRLSFGLLTRRGVPELDQRGDGDVCFGGIADELLSDKQVQRAAAVSL